MLGADTWSCLCSVGILFLWVFPLDLRRAWELCVDCRKTSGVLLGGGSEGFQVRVVSGH